MGFCESFLFGKKDYLHCFVLNTRNLHTLKKIIVCNQFMQLLHDFNFEYFQQEYFYFQVLKENCESYNMDLVSDMDMLDMCKMKSRYSCLCLYHMLVVAEIY